MNSSLAVQSVHNELAHPIPQLGTISVDSVVNKLWFILVGDASTSIRYLHLVPTFVQALNEIVPALQTQFASELEHVYLSRGSFHSKLKIFHHPTPLSEMQKTITEEMFDINGQSRIYQSSGEFCRRMILWSESRPSECIHKVLVFLTDCEENSSNIEFKTPVTIGTESWPTRTAYLADQIRGDGTKNAFVIKNYGAEYMGEKIREDLGFDVVQHFQPNPERMREVIINSAEETTGFMRTGRYTLS